MNKKELKEIEKIYTISRLGEVYKGDKLMKQGVCRSGYSRVGLTVNGKRKMYSVHRLVACKYVKGRTEIKNEVNHVDGNKNHNFSSNLEWVSRKENMEHARKVLKIKMGNIKQELKNEMVLYLLEKYSNKDIASLLGTTSENISRIKGIKCTQQKYKTC